MTTEREMLEFAAKACGLFDRGEWFDTTDGPVFVVGNKPFHPLINSADCAAMCAKLFIDSDWYADSIRTQNSTDFDTDHYEEWSYFKDNNNDREAAWRYAATMVAAKIGGMK